jgi:hypothetical protein
MTDQSPHHEPTNDQRAEWAKAALAVFTAETYSGDHPDTMHRDDLETAIGDLICNLLHLAAGRSMDAGAIHEQARGMFEQEVAEDERCDCPESRLVGPYHDTQRPVRIKAAASSIQNQKGNSAKPVPDLLDTLLDIKRLAEKSGDHEADPFALLNLIADAARAAVNKATKP